MGEGGRRRTDFLVTISRAKVNIQHAFVDSLVFLLGHFEDRVYLAYGVKAKTPPIG